MRHQTEGPQGGRRNPFLALGMVAALAGLIALALTAPLLQSPSPSAQSLAAPQWQIDAGGKMAFDVASVKQNKSGPPSSGDRQYSNVPLDPQDLYAPTGGLLSATNFPLIAYVNFAFKLTPNQTQAIISQLPKWANTDRYDIQGRASGNPTTDQLRLMMQALLKDRFRLTIHYETRELPIFALVLDKPGKLGPQLQPHPEGSTCSAAPPDLPSAPGPSPTVAGGFPEPCGAIAGLQPSVPGHFRAGARSMGMAMIANALSIPKLSGVDRPIVDKTGLTGKYDFVIEFTPPLNGSLPPDESGPTFLEALKEQLGLKLDPQTGPVDVVVIEHMEEPSEN